MLRRLVTERRAGGDAQCNAQCNNRRVDARIRIDAAADVHTWDGIGQ
jgi:hypothetical protein